MATDIIARGMAANAKKSVTELGNKIESEKWIGTRAEWEAVDKSTIKDGTIVYITDDEITILFNEDEIKKIATDVDNLSEVTTSLKAQVEYNTQRINDLENNSSKLSKSSISVGTAYAATYGAEVTPVVGTAAEYTESEGAE